MVIALKRRKIDLAFQLGEGSFGDTGMNTVNVSGLRVSAIIKSAGQAGMNMLDMRVYGLPPSIIKQISTLGAVYGGAASRLNSVRVSAGDDDGTSTVFIGTIQTAFQDYNGAPDVSLTIGAYTGSLESLKPVPPTSYPGSVDVADVMSALAIRMGFRFENGGVSVQLSKPYFAGTARAQAISAAEAANVNINMDNGTLAIWPKGKARGTASVLLSPDTGLVGYPSWMQTSLALKSLYNPSLVYGCPVEVKGSAVENANGKWSVYGLMHELESETPDGKWFTSIECLVVNP